MINNTIYIAPQQLEDLSHAYGKAIGKIVDTLKARLRYAAMPWQGGAAISRNYVELREAKSLLNHLKYPDDTLLIRVDEMAWALKVVKEACASDPAIPHSVLDKAAEMLGIDLNRQHIPMDMQRRINNEMQLLGGMAPVAPLAQAV